MKIFFAGLLALSATLGGALPASTSAEAHQRGQICRFQQIDRDGDVKTVSRYCHHLPDRYQDRPRAGLTLYFDFADGWYFGSQPRRFARQEQVCLVTFFRPSQVEAGADKNVQRAQVLPRRVAQRMDGPNDRKRIFDYGSNQQTRETCRYLDRLNA